MFFFRNWKFCLNTDSYVFHFNVFLTQLKQACITCQVTFHVWPQCFTVSLAVLYFAHIYGLQWNSNQYYHVQANVRTRLQHHLHSLLLSDWLRKTRSIAMQFYTMSWCKGFIAQYDAKYKLFTRTHENEQKSIVSGLAETYRITY